VRRAFVRRRVRRQRQGHGFRGIEWCSLDLLGDRWTLLVVRDLFAGESRFGDFLASPEGIATNILAARLQGLQSGGLVATEPCTERAGALRYRLTPRGTALFPVLAALKDWGLAHIPGTEARIRVPAPSKKTTKGR
jgi:DNA-binding HxlR family transcriptional regulator